MMKCPNCNEENEALLWRRCLTGRHDHELREGDQDEITCTVCRHHWRIPCEPYVQIPSVRIISMGEIKISGAVKLAGSAVAQREKVIRKVDIGSADHVLEINKEHGPWCVWPIRVSLDYAANMWVIEQQHCRKKSENEDEIYWAEVSRFPVEPESNTSCMDDLE